MPRKRAANTIDAFVTLTISNTQPGHSYRVQYTDVLPPDCSDLLHDPLATGTTLTVQDESVATTSQRYYRAKLLP